jgi:hypothetical protein
MAQQHGGALWRTALSVSGLLAALAAVAAVSTRYDGPGGHAAGRVLVEFSLVSLLGGAVMAVCLLSVVTWIGWSDRLARLRFSPLYPGVLLTAIGAAIVLTLAGAASFGVLHHGLHQTWRWPSEPEVQLARAVGFNVFVAGLGLKVAVFLAGRGWAWRNVALLFGLIGVAILVIVALAVWG